MKRVKSIGGRAYKFTSSLNRGLPDRMCVFPHGVLAFTELKAPGRKPTKKQEIELGYLRSMGQQAVVIDSRPKVDALIAWAIRKGEENAFQGYATEGL